MRVLARIKDHPEEVKRSYPSGVGNDDRTWSFVLHEVIRRRAPKNVIVAVMEAFPSALVLQPDHEHDNEYPIGIACRIDSLNSTDNIEMLTHATLAEMNKRQVPKCLLELSPFNFISFPAEHDNDAVRIVLEMYPQAINLRAYDQSVWENIYDSFEGNDYRDLAQSERKRYWERLKLLLTVANCGFANANAKENGLCLLQTMTIRTRGDDDVYPNENYLRHILISAIRYDRWLFASRNSQGDLPIHFFLDQKEWNGDQDDIKGRQIMQLFIAGYPGGLRIPNRNGLLPLQIAITTFWPFGDMLMLEPQALYTLNLYSGDLPFECACLNLGYMWRLHGEIPNEFGEGRIMRALNIAYKLIRLEPNLLRYRGIGTRVPMEEQGF